MEWLSIVAEVIRKSKDLYQITTPKGSAEMMGKFKGIPDYYPSYRESVKAYRKIKVHSELGDFPTELFAKRAPNQDDREAEWIRANFRNTTLPTFLAYISTTTRGLNDGNWSIEYRSEPRAQADDFAEYVGRGVPVIGSVESFIKNTLPTLKARDANGVLAVRPYKVPTTLTDDGSVVIDPNRPIDPIPVYYSCEQVVAYEVGEWYVLEMSEKSDVDYMGKVRKVGRQFECYDSTGIYRVRQVGKFTDHTFEVLLYYPMPNPFLAVKRLSGIPTPVGDSDYTYQSPFLFASDLLDSALVMQNYLYASGANCLFPIRYELGNECDFVDQEGKRCVKGQLTDLSGIPHGTCPSCKGTGDRSRLGPLGVIVLRPGDNSTNGDSSFSAPVGFASPDVSSLEKVREMVATDTARAESVIHINTRNADQKGAGADGTATAENRDEKAMYAFIQPISDQIFDLYDFTLKGIAVQRYGLPDLTPSLTYPKTFDFKTETDYLNEIKAARDSGMPSSVVTSMLLRYLQNTFGSDELAFAYFKLISEADKLFALTNDEIGVRLSQKTVERWQVVLHDSAFNLVRSLAASGTFFDQEFTVQVAQLEDAAKAATPADVAPLPFPNVAR